MKNQRLSPAFRIALAYLLTGGFWILLSDRVVALLFDPSQFPLIQTYKGCLFVLLTGCILYILIKNNQHNLKSSKQSFEDLFKSATVGIFQSSPEGRYIKVNEAMASIYGYDSPDAMIETITDISTQIYTSPDHRKRFMEILSRDGTVEKFEAQNLRKDGSIIWTSSNARRVQDENGTILYYEGFVTDITDRKNIEITLRETESRYRGLIEKLPATVFLDKIENGEPVHYYISPRIETLIGYSPEDWRADKDLWKNAIHPDDRGRVLAEDVRTNKTGEAFRMEYRLKHKNGDYIWVKEDSSIVRDENGMPVYWQGILLDITEQKKAKDAIRRRDAILRAVGFSAERFLRSTNWMETIGEVLNELGKATSVSRVYIFEKEIDSLSGSVSQLYEWSNDKVKPQIQNSELQNIDLRNNGFNRWIQLFEKGLPVVGNIGEFPDEERSLLESQGILSLICIPIQAGNDWWGFIGFDECNSPREWSEAEIEALRTAANTLGNAIERNIFEEALQNSEASYRGLFDAVHDAIYIQDSEGRFVDVNEGAVRMYGYPKDFFIGKTPEFLSAPGKNNLDRLFRAIQNAFKGEPQYFEFWGMRSDGSIFPKEVRLYKAAYFGQDVIIAMAQDITDRKQAEETLQIQLRELSVLHLAALTTATARNVDTLVQHITDIISDSLYSDNCGVLLLNETGEMLVPHYSYRGTDIKNIGTALPVTEGISGRVIAMRRPMRVGDVTLEPSYYMLTSDTRSELCVPIMSGSTIYGVLNVESKKLAAFTERDERLLNTIAGGLANAIERIRLFELEKKRRLQAEILREATGELTSFFDREKLFENIFETLAKLVEYDSASIEMLHKGQSQVVAVKDIPKYLIGVTYPTDIRKWYNTDKPRHPLIIEDVHEDDRFTILEETSYIRGWMGIPLLAQDQLVGFLNLDSKIPGFFTEEHAAIAHTFANQAGIALENARLFELEQRRRQDAENLSLATTSLTKFLDFDDLMENILDWLEKLTPYDSASIMLSEGNVLKLKGMRNLPEEYYIGRVFPKTDKWEKVIQSRKPLIIEDVQTDKVFEKWEGTEYIRGWMAVGMFTQDTFIGFINIDSRTPGAYAQEHASLIQTFANQAATAIERVRLFDLETKRRQEAETLMHAATALTNLLDLPSLHNAILDWLYQIAPYDSASILETEGDHLRITATKGLPEPKKAMNQLFPADNVLCRLINESGQAVIINDCWNDPRFERWGNAQHVRGWMGVPLISRGQIIGYLTLDSRAPNAYSQSDAITAQTFAHQAATALENTKLYLETKQRLEELEMVSRASYALRAARDTDEMLPILLEELKKSIGTDTASIFIYNPETNELLPRATSNWLRKLPKKAFRPDEGITGKVFTSGEIYVSSNVIHDPLADQTNLEYFGEGWGVIAVPIRTTNDIIGVLIVGMKYPQRIEDRHIRLLTTLAEIAGNAIHRSTLYERSEEQIRRLTTLREMDSAITSSLDLTVTLDILAEHLQRKLGVSAARILIFNPNSQMLDCYTAAGFAQQSIARKSIGIGEGITSQVLLSRHELHIRDINEEKPEFHPEELFKEGFKSYYAVPLLSKGATRGILETYFHQLFTPSTDWKDFLKTLAGQATIGIDNTQLFENLQRTNQELSLAYDTTLEGWGKALELRDKETEGHTRRVTNLTVELARRMGIPESDMNHLRRGALLHDIGKMGVPDHILRKPGPLTKQEIKEMRKHPQYAFDLLAPITYLRPTLDIAYCHHEWWNGKGYPRGLKGEEIPLSARIFAVVDVWDALLSDRPYRSAWKMDDVQRYIADLTGKQFDPEVVNAFKKMIEEEPKLIASYLPKKPRKTITKGTVQKNKKKR
jgi:PAS domain S-box-containing protein/putative nucleotidyltransferase with HDIG domain